MKLKVFKIVVDNIIVTYIDLLTLTQVSKKYCSVFSIDHYWRKINFLRLSTETHIKNNYILVLNKTQLISKFKKDLLSYICNLKHFELLNKLQDLEFKLIDQQTRFIKYNISKHNYISKDSKRYSLKILIEAIYRKLELICLDIFIRIEDGYVTYVNSSDVLFWSDFFLINEDNDLKQIHFSK